ncbi:hypothetical protein DLM75_16870 [Leptospira stimsonii]|uniref:Uncharacterized protein n=1 Tax=Leptospira stimsonii TaxID=2202203 RepID=A0A396YX85_9LEPT|nr:hypothetical protein DLM75_16870 [Leptospira stimsonii]
MSWESSYKSIFFSSPFEKTLFKENFSTKEKKNLRYIALLKEQSLFTFLNDQNPFTFRGGFLCSFFLLGFEKTLSFYPTSERRFRFDSNSKNACLYELRISEKLKCEI